MQKTDVALIVCSEEDIEQELEWAKEFKARKAPVVMVINKIDQIRNTDKIRNKIYEALKVEPVKISAISKVGIERIREEIIRNLPEDFDARSITGDLVSEGDTVLLVMPQDIQAPKGRLILPQVQTLRELLDKKCIVLSSTADRYEEALASMVKPPKLIITDSQVFGMVYEKKPADSMLTSFSVLFASHKGDIDYFVKSSEVIDKLTEKSKVLIAEACTHVPLTEDIGREKLPRMLRSKAGEGLTIVNVSGNDFPKDLTEFDLVIQCGACMFNRKYVMSRVELAKQQNVPMTNYGITIAYLTKILDKITIV
jgi:[FeFe] hydrogenase H-cluster maturation GTPase HydF